MLKQQEVLGGYDPTQYVSERQWATARDGVKVPLSIVYKKGFHARWPRRSSSTATDPTASACRRRSPVRGFACSTAGMAYVIAHIRGGDEMGEPWHDDGMLMKKKNTFYDFIDSAEYLIREQWTSKDRLVIEGGSAGGLLMGAVVNLRPDLFHAVHRRCRSWT